MEFNAGSKQARSLKQRAKDILSNGEGSSLITVSAALLVLIAIFSFSTPYFFTINNLLNIGLYAAIMGTIACSMTFILSLIHI